MDKVSRATETNFESMDEIGVFVYQAGAPELIGAGAYHSPNMHYYTADGSPDGTTSPKWTTTEPLGAPLAYGKVYYGVAYYPYQSGMTNATKVAHQVATDQTKAKALENSDFMWGKPLTIATHTATPTARFTFSHLMCRLVLSLDVPTLIDGSIATKVNKIAIKNLKTQCTIHLGTGVLDNSATVADITPRLVSGNSAAGATTVWEAIVVPQTVASGVSIVEAKIQTAAGEKTVQYALPSGGLTLGSGQKINYLLTNSVAAAFTTELANAHYSGAYTDQLLFVKVSKGANWTLTSSATSWLTVSKTSGTGTGAEEAVYVSWTANTGSTLREATLTLTATGKGSATYRVAQPNFVVPNVTTVFPATIAMATATYRLPAITVGNGNWYLKSDSHNANVRFSRFNKAFSSLLAADTIAVFNATTSGLKSGLLVSGDYQNYNGQIWIVVKPGSKPTFTMSCAGKAVTVNASAI